MPASFDGKLVVAISSRALFDLEESNRVFEEQGVNAYYRYQLEHENEILAPGIAFALVRKLLRLNTLAPAQPRVEVILLSRNTADTGMRIMNASEVTAAKEPLSGGPFKSFLAALHRIQSEFPADRAPIRTALVTARSAPAHERVVRTLRAWNIRIDEALFLGGLDKGPFLKAFGADIFFDDQRGHVESASRHVATGHVPFGVANE